MTNETPQWEKEFDRRFTFIQSWTGGVGLSQGSSESPSLKQDIIGLKAFIKEQLEKLIDSIPDIYAPDEKYPSTSDRLKAQLRKDWL